MSEDLRIAAIQHIDWEPLVQQVKVCQHPKITQLIGGDEDRDNAVEEIIMMMADQLDAITQDTDSHDAALEWAATEYEIPVELLARVFYDENTPLADLIRSARELPGMKKGRRTPLARLISIMYGARYKSEKDWKQGKRTLLNFARAVGPKFYRRVMPIIQLADNPKEAVHALVDLGRSKRKPKTALIKGSWISEEIANKARRVAQLGLGDFHTDVNGFELRTTPATLRVFGLAGESSKTKKIASNLVTACRKQGINVIDLDVFEVGSEKCLTAKLRIPNPKALELAKTLATGRTFQMIEIHGLGK